MQQFLVWIAVATVSLLVIEIAAGRHRGVYRKEDLALAIGSFLLGRWLMVPLATGLIATVFSLALPGFQGRLAGTPFWVAVPGVLLASEFCFYWVHRWAHESRTGRRPFLWMLHRTHHSGKFMNVSLLYRLNIFWFFVIPVGWVTGLALYLGLGEAVLAVILIIQAWNLITHSHFRWDDRVRRHRLAGPVFRALEHVVVSPGIHHTHHGFGTDGKSYRNYAIVLSLYDWMFGTLHIPEGRPAQYGLPGGNAHWLEELLWPVVRIKPQVQPKAGAAPEVTAR